MRALGQRPRRLHGRQFLLHGGHLRLQGVRLLLQVGQFRLDRGPLGPLSGLQLALELPHLGAHFLAQPVLLGLLRLHLGQDGAATLVERDQAVEVDRGALVGGALPEAIGVLAEGLRVDHGAGSITPPHDRRIESAAAATARAAIAGPAVP